MGIIFIQGIIFLWTQTYEHMNIYGDSQICISVPLSALNFGIQIQPDTMLFTMMPFSANKCNVPLKYLYLKIYFYFKYS